MGGGQEGGLRERGDGQGQAGEDHCEGVPGLGLEEEHLRRRFFGTANMAAVRRHLAERARQCTAVSSRVLTSATVHLEGTPSTEKKKQKTKNKKHKTKNKKQKTKNKKQKTKNKEQKTKKRKTKNKKQITNNKKQKTKNKKQS